MAQLPASSTGGGDYDYPDDFTEGSDDHDLPLPGLGDFPIARFWPGGDDWLLPGIVNQQSRVVFSSGDSSSSSGEDQEGPASGAFTDRAEALPGVVRAGGARRARSPAVAGAAANIHPRDPWAMQGDGGAGPSAAAGTAGMAQARFAGSAVAGGELPARLASGASGRSLFGPFGSSSLQHRDSLQSMQPHPLTLTVQHHQIPPPPPRPPPTPVQQQQPVQQLQQRQQLDRDRDREQEVGTGAGASRLGGGDRGDEEDGRRARIAGSGGGGGAGTWSFLDPDPFALGTSSSCSSSLSASRDASPGPHPPAAQPPFALHGRGGGGGGPQPWYGSQYDNSQYEHDFGAGIGSRMPRRRLSSSSVGDVGGGGRIPLGGSEEDDEEPPRRLSRGMGSFGLGLGDGPASDTLHGAGGSDSSHGSWAERHGLGARYEGSGPRISQSTAAAMVLWPLGPPGDVLLSPGVPGRPVGGPVGALESDWPLRPEHLRLHRHVPPRLRPGELSRASWRPEQQQRERERQREEDDDGADELRASMAGTSSLALGSSGDPSSWEHPHQHHYGGLGGRGSLGLSLGGGSSWRGNRYSPRSTLGESDLSGLGGPGNSMQAAGSRAATPGGPSGSYRAAGYGGSGGGGGGLLGSSSLGGALAGGGSGNGGATLCFTSLDSPSGPYDRRRIVLTSAHRRAQPEAAAPSVRQYSDGLAGMLTNAQIQEWMSQHASRLLLPRHMQEIADIVFRPPSAVPEKKPLKCQAGVGPSLTLPPPVVLGGRYPPLHISRLAGDAAFMSDLLAALPGVDPTSSRLLAVVTALAGKDVVVREEGEGGEGEPAAGLSLLTKGGPGLRPPSRIQPK